MKRLLLTATPFLDSPGRSRAPAASRSTSLMRQCREWMDQMPSTLLVTFFVIAAGPAPAQQQVLTYHYDNQRTGWNQNETILTPATVTGLQLLASVALDDKVDAQPLVYNNVIYVATKNNSVYAIDTSGIILMQSNFGPAVGNFGILSTPVIDPGSSTLYVMVYFDANNDPNNQLPTYQLHALDTSSLTDKVTPITVSAPGRLTNGSIYQFDASLTEQRPALLLSANGNIYAGFGGFYDNNPNASRGWLLGWQGGSLTSLPNNYLANRLANDIDDFFLTSIWMSGAGIAENGSANLFFATGNSGFSGNDYRPKSNLSESVVQLSPDLSTVESYFTPYGGVLGGHYMEQNDLDMGSGGVLVLPDGYVVAAGKTGEMYLLQQGNLGGNAPKNYVARAEIGPCWCTESYYVGSDGGGRIVSSGGNQTIQVWLEPSLTMESQSPPLNGGGGFFTSVSSSGAQNLIVWAVDRPADTNYELTLWAYDPTQGVVLGSWPAGTWPNSPDEFSKVVPIVANGQVYVASYQQLTIWGLRSPSSTDPPPAPAALAHPVFKNPVPLAAGEHDVFGTITAIDGSSITVRRRDGTLANVDTSNATAAPLMIDEPVRVIGSGTETALHARRVSRAKGLPKLWPDDR